MFSKNSSKSTLSRIFLLTCLFFAATFFYNNAFAQSAPITTDSRIKTLVYNANEVYQLKFHYGYQSYIEFSDDEEIEMISIGESFAWRLTPAGKRLFIRPLEIAAHTNMTIITNRRTYQFDIRSGEYDGRADEELVYIVRFYYPEIGIPLPIPPQLSVQNIGKKPLSSMTGTSGIKSGPDAVKPIVKTPTRREWIDRDLDPETSGNPRQASLNFSYTIVGLSENITPTKIYDNGTETFFQFRNNNLIIPSINEVDALGGERPLNYTIKDNYVVVHTVANQFSFRLDSSLICVFNGNKKNPKKSRLNIYQKFYNINKKEGKAK